LKKNEKLVIGNWLVGDWEFCHSAFAERRISTREVFNTWN